MKNPCKFKIIFQSLIVFSDTPISWDIAKFVKEFTIRYSVSELLAGRAAPDEEVRRL